ncbi:MAG TPA: DUF2079 domain-containing protein [Patescibacteria group bacterium]|nr:DUF2079 domain-containing protein [Patescibacteria group bacterium]
MQLLLLWILLLTILYSTLAIVRHNHFESGGFDLGLYDQEVWQYSRFLVPYNTVKDELILADHLNLTTPLISPIFWIWNDVRMLLIFQSFWVTLSALAIFGIAKKRKLTPTVSLAIAVIYSLFYGIQYMIFFDFHAVAIGVGLLAWLCYFWETKNEKLFIITVLLLLLTQENMGIALSCVSFLYIFRKEYRVRAVFLFIIGIVWTFIAAKIIGSLSQAGFQYSPTISSNPMQIAADFINSDEKRQVWLYTLTSFSFIPVFSIGAMLAVGLDLAQYFVTGPHFARMWSPFLHHRAILAVFLALGVIEIMSFLKKKHINVEIVALMLLLSCIAQQYMFHYPLNKLTKSAFWQQEQWMKDNESMIAIIPKAASIATQQSLIPHLSHRKNIYLVWPRVHDIKSKPCGQISCWWLDFGGHPQYLLIDLHENEWLTQLLETNDHVTQALTNMQKTGNIHLSQKIGDVALYTVSNAH